MPPSAMTLQYVPVSSRCLLVLDARRGGIGDGGRLRHADAQHGTRGAGVARTDAHQHADGARAHQVQRGGIRRAAADDHGYRHVGDELLQIERR